MDIVCNLESKQLVLDGLNKSRFPKRCSFTRNYVVIVDDKIQKISLNLFEVIAKVFFKVLKKDFIASRLSKAKKVVNLTDQSKKESRRLIDVFFPDLPKKKKKTKAPKPLISKKVTPLALVKPQDKNKVEVSQPIPSVKPKKMELEDIRRELKGKNPELTLGQGEYLVYRSDSAELTQKTYAKVFQVFETFRSEVAQGKESYAERHTTLSARIKKIDCNLKMAFVSRTLYELFYIRQMIEEDLASEKALCPVMHYDFKSKMYAALEQEEDDQLRAARNAAQEHQVCWHLGPLKEGQMESREQAKIMGLAYRINQLFAVKKPLSYSEIMSLAEKQISFLKGCHINTKSKNAIKLIGSYESGGQPNRSSLFSTEGDHGSGSKAGLGIRDEADAEILRNAIALECSEVAQKSLFVYRGAAYEQDNPLKEKEIHCLSYGAGVFAGAFWDAGATAFHYMKKCDAYALPVVVDERATSPLYIPWRHPIQELASKGEVFHSRSKVWEVDGDTACTGFLGALTSKKKDLPRELSYSGSKEGFLKRYQLLKESAFFLKKRFLKVS